MRTLLNFRMAACLLVSLAVANSHAQDTTTSQLLSKYDAIYKPLVDAFRASDDTEQRFALVKQASAEINAMLSDTLTSR